VPANGTKATITVTLTDVNNTPVVGHTVTLDDGAASSTIGAASGPSNASGEVTFQVSNTTVEVATYTATDTTNAVTVTQKASVTFTATPSGVTITNLTVASRQAYVVSGAGLQVGGRVYIDRTYTFTNAPAFVQGQAYIQTANDDKAATTATFLSFTVDHPVSVSVAYDVRITPKPAWLSTFTDTGLNLVTSDTTLRLFVQSFPAGPITLGGNAGSGGSMYSVIVQPSLPLTIWNQTVASGQAYVVPATGLQIGGPVYIDRGDTFTTVPTRLQGAAYIQTANNDKSATTAAFLSFAVNQPVSVSVAYDVRITPKPAWLSTFTDTGINLVTSDTSLRLFLRSFPAGTITLGGNAGSGGSMYSVIVQPLSASKASTEVFWRNISSGEVAVWRMNGLTITSVGFPGSTSTDWNIEQVGDMSGDGEGDILWRNTISGVVAIWLMNEGTTISSGFLGGVSAEWVISGIGDMNGDGKADVLWRNSSSEMVSIWFMDGLSINSVGFLGNIPAVWEMEQVGDVNGDGKADLVWQNRTNGTVAVWLMNGLTITSVGFPASTSLDWEIQILGDLNGDSQMDVIWRNKNSGMVSVWLMNGTTIASSGVLGSMPFEWEIKQVSDVNSDGKGDVIWHHRTIGAVAVWLMNGATVTAVGFPGSLPPEWEIQP
jgi:hypothetical protein